MLLVQMCIHRALFNLINTVIHVICYLRCFSIPQFCYSHGFCAVRTLGCCRILSISSSSAGWLLLLLLMLLLVLLLLLKVTAAISGVTTASSVNQFTITAAATVTANKHYHCCYNLA
jgi:hypothetical protein